MRNYIRNTCIILALALHNPHGLAAEGYTVLPNEVRNSPEVVKLLAQDPNKVQVLLFFSYACGACAKFEPKFDHWLHSHANKQFVVYRFPVTFADDDWRQLANMYYIAQTLDPSQDLSNEIFAGIFQHGERLWHKDAMRAFFLAHGYTEAQFDAAVAQNQAHTKTQLADALSTAYGIAFTPAIVVNGTDSSFIFDPNQNHEDFFAILDQVIHQQMQAKIFAH